MLIYSTVNTSSFPLTLTGSFCTLLSSPPPLLSSGRREYVSVKWSWEDDLVSLFCTREMARTDFSSVGHVRLPFCLSSFFVDQGHRVRSRPNYPYSGAIRCVVDGGTPSVGRSQSFSASPPRQACYAPTLSLIRAKPRAVFDSRSPPVGLSSGHSTDIAMGVRAIQRKGKPTAYSKSE